jgi:ligand-binding sensor domain-containing protein
MRHFLVFGMLLLNQLSFSQTWKNLTSKEWVYSIDEEDDFLWVGTSGGLVKLNKQTKESVAFDRATARIPDNNVLSLCVEANNYIWLGSRFSGLGSFKNEEAITYNSENSNIPNDQYCMGIAIDSDNNKYLGSLGYVSIFKNGQFEIIKEMDVLSPFENINDIKFNNDMIWMASFSGLYKYDGIKTEKVPDISGNVSSVEFDGNNKLWAGSDNGLYCYNGTSWYCYNKDNSGLPSNSIQKICFDSNNNLWISTYSNLVCYSSAGTWTTYNCTSQTLDHFDIFTLYVDRDDNLWIGTRDNGLMIFKNNSFEKVNYTKPSVFPSNTINSIAFVNNTVWFGVDNYGLYNFDGQAYHNWDTLNSGLSNPQVLIISSDKAGSIWMVTKKTTITSSGATTDFKLTLFDGNQFTDMETPVPASQVRVLKVDDNNIFWFATSKGLYRWDGINCTNYNTDNSPLSSDVINKIDFDSKGNIWIGQNGNWDNSGILIGGGLMKFDGNDTWQEYTVFNSPLPYNTIKALKVDKNDAVWLGTVNDEVTDGGGLTKLAGETWQSFTKENSGISDNQVLDINEDSKGIIWCGTLSGGLAMYDKVDKWSVFKQSNSGIASNSVNSILIDQNDKIWMSHNGYSGVSVYDNTMNSSNINITDSDNEIRIYPNPVNDYLTIESSSPNAELLSIEIVDLQGKTIMNKILPGNSKKECLNMGFYKGSANAVLLVKVTTDQSIFQRKVILVKL